MLSRTSFTTRRLHTRRSLTYSTTYYYNDDFMVDSIIARSLQTWRIELSAVHMIYIERHQMVCVDAQLKLKVSRRWEVYTRNQNASWNFHTTERTNTNNKQEIQWTESWRSFSARAISHLHWMRGAKNLTQLLSMQRERVRKTACRSSEIYDFRYLARALSDARTSIHSQWPTQPVKYFDKSFCQTELLSPAQSN